MSWTKRETINGIDVGYTDALWYDPQDSQSSWNRPAIALTRKSIKSLKLLNLSSEDLIQFLYERIHHAECIEAKYRIRRMDNSRFTPMHKMKRGFVYFMYCEAKQLMKIGCSHDPNTRKSANAKAIGAPLELVKSYEANGMYELENEFHELFSRRWHQGEWFMIKPKHIKIADWYLSRKEGMA